MELWKIGSTRCMRRDMRTSGVMRATVLTHCNEYKIKKVQIKQSKKVNLNNN